MEDEYIVLMVDKCYCDKKADHSGLHFHKSISCSVWSSMLLSFLNKRLQSNTDFMTVLTIELWQKWIYATPNVSLKKTVQLLLALLSWDTYIPKFCVTVENFPLPWLACLKSIWRDHLKAGRDAQGAPAILVPTVHYIQCMWVMKLLETLGPIYDWITRSTLCQLYQAKLLTNFCPREHIWYNKNVTSGVLCKLNVREIYYKASRICNSIVT